MTFKQDMVNQKYEWPTKLWNYFIIPDSGWNKFWFVFIFCFVCIVFVFVFISILCFLFLFFSFFFFLFFFLFFLFLIFACLFVLLVVFCLPLKNGYNLYTLPSSFLLVFPLPLPSPLQKNATLTYPTLFHMDTST